jgi:hypothetical protein
VAQFRRPDDNGTLGAFALDEPPILHTRQLVRETALFPFHHFGEFLLPHFAVAESNQAGEDAELRPGKPRGLRNVSPDASPNFFAHVLKDAPETEFLGGQRFSSH